VTSGPSDTARSIASVAEANSARARHMWAMGLSASLVLIVCIRFFSEDLRMVPRVVQYIDVPITLTVACCAVLAFIRKGYVRGKPRLGGLLYLFVCVSLVSAWINASRTELLPVAMFIFNFTAPLIIAVATIHARLERKDVQYVVRTFFWLGVLQLTVGVFYGLPRFFVSKNPDMVSGTFGQNAYQFTYFIGLWLLYILGGTLVGPDLRRRGRNVGVGLAALTVFGLFYAAQYRSMLIFFTLVILLVLWVSPARVSRRALMTITISAASVITLLVVATAYPELKLLKVFDLFEDSSPVAESGKIQAVKNVVTMYGDLPQAVLVGSGPATFSSRAYQTFSNKPRPEKEAIGALAVRLGGGQYTTDVSRRYIASIPFKPIQGGTTASSPWSSFTTLAAEVGPIGLVVYLWAYLMALVFSYRRLRAGPREGDYLGPRLAFVCFGGLLLLLVQALFDNWLETTRVAIPLWLLVGLLYTLERGNNTTVAPETPASDTLPASH
jgi:hypothetical protein